MSKQELESKIYEKAEDLGKLMKDYQIMLSQETDRTNRLSDNISGNKLLDMDIKVATMHFAPRGSKHIEKISACLINRYF